MLGPQTTKEVGIPLLIQPNVWGGVSEEGIDLRPGFEEWWTKLLLDGDLYPFMLTFNHTAMTPGGTDDEQVTLDSDCYLLSIEGMATRDTGSFRAQFYEVVDEGTGLHHMRIGVNDGNLVGTARRQAFLPHPYKMTAGQSIMSRCLNLDLSHANTVQIVIYSVKHWKLTA